MLQLSHQARRTVQPAFICTSCRHILGNHSTYSTSASPSPSSAPAATPSQSEPAPSPGNQTTGGVRRAPTGTKKKSKRKSKDSRNGLWRQTLSVLKDIQAGRLVLTPVAPQAASPSTEPKDSDVHADDSTEVKESADTKAPKTKASPRVATGPKPYAPKLLDGAVNILMKVLNDELSASKGKTVLSALEEKGAHILKAGENTGIERPKIKEASLKQRDEPKAKQRQPKLRSEESTPRMDEADSEAKPIADNAAGSQKERRSKPRPKPTMVDRNTGLPVTPSGVSMKKTKKGFTVRTINPETLELTAVEKKQPPVPKLSYGLDRVLFNPGVYTLQDPRSRVFNFDPYLARIMPIKEFDFNALKQYITSSKDTTLIGMASEHNRKYTGSTSSMTSMLAHFHFLLSSWREIKAPYVSRDFNIESTNFSKILRAPAATFLHYKDGTYAIDADKEFDTANVLSMLGKSMEKLLTLPKEEFELYRKTKSDQLSEEERNGPEAYHYTTMGDFMMRSQLDAYDPRIPGTGMFDLKTRAVVSIRMDARDHKKGMDYEIRDRVGQWESYEREYFDMIRNAFMKYSLQVRMGRMDGIFVAFHNTQRIFGFQYIPLTEMDMSLHGTPNKALGDQEFKLSLHLLNEVLDKATARFPGRSLRFFFETRPSTPPFMYIFAQPVTPEQIDEVQTKNREKVEQFERDMMGMEAEGTEVEGTEPVTENSQAATEGESGEDYTGNGYVEGETSLDTWEDIMNEVEEALENEEQGVTSVREAIEDALQQSGLLRTSTPEEAHRYFDALLEALTSSTASSPTVSDAAASDMAAKSSPIDGESRLLDTGSDYTPPTQDQMETSPESMDDMSIEEKSASGDKLSPSQSEDQDPIAETVEPEPESEKIELDEGGSSLKDLILRLASQVKVSSHEHKSTKLDEETEEDVTEDAVKLRSFERILSELMAKNRETRGSEAERSNEGDERGTSAPGEEVSSSGGSEEAAPGSVKIAQGSTGTSPTSVEGETAMDESVASDEKDHSPAAAEVKNSRSEETDVLGMILTVRNKVDGKYVDRPPETFDSSNSWEVEYAIEDIDPERAKTLYKNTQKRREGAFFRLETDTDPWLSMFRGKLLAFSTKGREFRESETEFHEKYPIHVYGRDKPLDFQSVFGTKDDEFLPDGLTYKEWNSEEHPHAKWEHTPHRDEWATLLANQNVHAPIFEEPRVYPQQTAPKRTAAKGPKNMQESLGAWKGKVATLKDALALKKAKDAAAASNGDAKKTKRELAMEVQAEKLRVTLERAKELRAEKERAEKERAEKEAAEKETGEEGTAEKETTEKVASTRPVNEKRRRRRHKAALKRRLANNMVGSQETSSAEPTTTESTGQEFASPEADKVDADK
ncbi:mitochondrial protein Pet127-domain-containing protein [Apodospora peruviana]|uniref:Mitochondrial protein Pet127-domain-containing protein n=1 Tax=Apodospora peruviana TaxID=516989 RepID=A0AAE0IIB4_9PEZI|nr:mitochondrial protein Pet127-domain-containing protein [Apodospora peruviana]